MGDYLSVVLALLALSFSIYVFGDSRRRDRRDMFLKLHESLISDDLQRGRQLLFTKVTDQSSVERLSDHDYRDINRALGTYNILGLYLKNKYVTERDVIDLWAEPVYSAWRAALPFIAHREHNHGFRPYRYFEELAEKMPRGDRAKKGVYLIVNGSCVASRRSP